MAGWDETGLGWDLGFGIFGRLGGGEHSLIFLLKTFYPFANCGDW